MNKQVHQINYITDINTKPNFKLNEHKSNTLICGDLHGNFIKLLDFCLICDFVDVSKTDYCYITNKIYNNVLKKELYNSYNKEVYINNSKEFNLDILNKIIFKESKNQLILLGDVFGDRNIEDLLKVEFIKLLNSKTNNHLTILYGNHDNAAFNILNNKNADCLPCVSDFLYLTKNQKSEYLIDFLNIVNKNYTLIKKVDNFILSHAPIRLDIFNYFKYNNENNISQICENINLLMKKHNESNLNPKEENIFNYFIWDRYSQENMYIKDDYKEILQICGHDTFTDSKHRLLSLNNVNGKIKTHFEYELLICF